MTYSAVIPVYDRPELVKDAIESVFRQTAPAAEIIVVDDGSHGLEIAQYLPRVTLVRHEVNKGVSAVRNSGVKVATSQYIAFLDSDDLWLPAKMQTQLDFMNAHAVKVSHSDEFWYRAGRWINQGKQHTKYGGEIFPYILDKCRVSPSSLVVDRAIFVAVGGFDESLRVCEDYEICLRLAACHEFGYIDKKLIIKRDVADNSLSRGIEHIESIRLDILSQFIADNALTPAHLEVANREIERKRGIVKNLVTC